jgi:hypothetical protein
MDFYLEIKKWAEAYASFEPKIHYSLSLRQELLSYNRERRSIKKESETLDKDKDTERNYFLSLYYSIQSRILFFKGS